ncbi:MAG: hypothetical protein DHS20C15_01090 [Planctomycetota bacterium]|nr:MAG: hypothetical protein DHS20C15_01090 [Planctomycetota bacterium]
MGTTSRVRAHLELLRAPLLLTPTSDVLGGAAWSATLAGVTLAPGPTALAALCGSALLVSGMAHNAWVDRHEDAQHKPDRPLARGAVSPSVVHAYWLGGAALALGLTWARPALLLPALGVLAASHAYHWGLKRSTLGGCVALGAARTCDMALGLALFAPRWSWTLAAPALLHGSFVALASWHAAHDDEAREARAPALPAWRLAAGLLALVAIALPFNLPLATALPAGAVLLGCALRIARAAPKLPPPALTGVLLSSMPWLAASVALAAGQHVAAVLAASLFFAAGRLRRRFPPS